MDDNYTSFGDTRISDQRGHVSGSYHVLLPDGRHQHVNYKDEGNGYVAHVRYNNDDDNSGSASNVVEYKQKIDNNINAASHKFKSQILDEGLTTPTP